jgi:septal ring factor EnvC (AmiA/AmiB activator)
MERARHKIEEVIKKQKWLQEQSHAKTESSSAKDKSQYMIALGGIAAGLTIAVIFMLAKSLVTKEHTNMFSADQDNAIQTVEIGKPSDEIAMLNERVESLSKSVSNLEDQLTHVIALADSIAIVETNRTASSPQQIPESADTNPTLEANESNVSRAVQTATETGEAFIPSHTVKARVNLRPSASLHTTPIAVLNVGTEVEYISKSDGWYYVNTLAHGKGWCSSEYLSPLSPTQ